MVLDPIYAKYYKTAILEVGKDGEIRKSLDLLGIATDYNGFVDALVNRVLISLEKADQTG